MVPTIGARRVFASLAAVVVVAIALGFLPAAQAQETRDPVFVLKVGAVEVARPNRASSSLSLRVSAIVSTLGYSHPRLVSVLYEKPPADGIQDLYFLVDPPAPGTFVPQVITPVSTSVEIGPIPEWLRGIRVWARTNRMETPL